MLNRVRIIIAVLNSYQSNVISLTAPAEFQQPKNPFRYINKHDINKGIFSIYTEDILIDKSTMKKTNTSQYLVLREHKNFHILKGGCIDGVLEGGIQQFYCEVYDYIIY